MLSYPQPVVEKTRKLTRIKLGILVISAIFTLVILNSPLSVRSGAYSIKAGDVAIQDIQAPKAFSYTSDYLTTQLIQQTRNSVPAIYLPVDPAIKKRQLELLGTTLEYITRVRDDKYASADQKNQDLANIANTSLSDQSILTLINLSAGRWQSIIEQSRKLLDETMRMTIRDDNVFNIRRNLESQIDISLSSDQVRIITEIVSPLVLPNSSYSEELTNQAKDEAEAAVQPVIKNYAAGQLIVQHGQIVHAEDYEALAAAGLTVKDNRLNNFLGSVSLVVVLSVFIGLYTHRRRANPLDDLRSLLLIAITFNVFLLLARFAIPYRAIIPFIFPLAAFGLVLTTAFNLETGLVFSLVLSILSAYGLPGSLEITIYYIIGSLTGILVLGRGRRVASFFYASVGISLANMAIILAYRLNDPGTDLFGLATLGAAALTNGLASASLTLIIQFVFSQVLGITTALQLLEISRADHPLLQYILRNAPGTYQHSLQVANLAEQAAELINADSLLIRVGALYHDAGKALNPQFFIENQIRGHENPHTDMDPAISASIIIKHVNDGVSLAKKFHLPTRIHDFINEHHGSMITRYQFNRAVEAAGGESARVDKTHYLYPGPAPRSRETALLMLADGCEARARAELPTEEAEIRALVNKVVDYAMNGHQLDQTKLTLMDINKIIESFTSTLMGIYHQRIIYPESTQPVIEKNETE